MPTVFSHRIQNCFGLETSRFQGGTSNMTTLRVLRDTDYTNELLAMNSKHKEVN